MATNVLLFISGIILFLFGMTKLSGNMQSIFSVRIRENIKYSVKKPVYGFITGILATIFFQSSSATTILTVGIVSAGLISFYNSLGILLGADIGTTFTVQLVAWKITSISPLILFTGGIIWLVGKEGTKNAGESIFYFGMIFFGLSLVAQSTAPLKETPLFMEIFQKARNPLIGIAIGIIFTGIVQASAIPISILVILGLQGLITLDIAFPIVLGANIGTTVTAFLASAFASINGKRTAIAHFIFKVCGVLICLVFLPVIIPLLKGLSEQIAQQIVLGHVFYNSLVAVVFMFFLKPFAALIRKMLPGEAVVLPLWPEYLQEKSLSHPQASLECVRKELTRDITLTRQMLIDSYTLIDTYKEVLKKNIEYIEMIVDNLQSEISRYLNKISAHLLTPEQSKRLFAYSGMVDDIERIGDNIVNLAVLSKYRYRSKAEFSQTAMNELREIEQLVAANLDDTIFTLENNDQSKIGPVFKRERMINEKVDSARQMHLERFCTGECQAEAGPIFIDILINLERVSDHCENIAEYFEQFDMRTD